MNTRDARVHETLDNVVARNGVYKDSVDWRKVLRHCFYTVEKESVIKRRRPTLDTQKEIDDVKELKTRMEGMIDEFELPEYIKYRLEDALQSLCHEVDLLVQNTRDKWAGQ